MTFILKALLNQNVQWPLTYSIVRKAFLPVMWPRWKASHQTWLFERSFILWSIHTHFCLFYRAKLTVNNWCLHEEMEGFCRGDICRMLVWPACGGQKATQICAVGKMPQHVSMLCSLVACGQWCVDESRNQSKEPTHTQRSWTECDL